jgi:nucleoside 2-deoxyribosyltransferase
MVTRVFISYARDDRALAESVAKQLARSGIETWSEFDVEAGTQIEDSLLSKLTESDAIVAIVSNASAHSSGLGYELGAARAMRKRVVLVRQKDAPADDVYSSLTDTQTLNAAELSPDEIADQIRTQLAA